jgi:hypothetical protein
MPRPKFIPTEERRRIVRSMAGYGVSQQDIATSVGLRSTKTLRKHFRRELDGGGVDAKAKVLQTLFKMATSGNHPAATIFWVKTRLGWREIQIVENRPAVIPDFVIAEEKEAA